MTLWKDFLDYRSRPIVYSDFGEKNLEHWKTRPGNSERIENLRWARDNCGGLFRVVIAVAKDTNADPRAISECYPQDKLIMRLLELNEDTGEFRAISVEST